MFDETAPAHARSDSGTIATVYCRSQVSEAVMRRHLERLNRQREAGAIARVERRWWPARIPVDDHPTGRATRRRFKRFEQWADATGVELTPAFELKTLDCAVTGLKTTVITTPTIGLTIEVNGRLCGVFPHREGQSVRTVADGIDGLETGPTVATDSENSRPLGKRCPTCDETIANIQGIPACTQCGATQRNFQSAVPVETARKLAPLL